MLENAAAGMHAMLVGQLAALLTSATQLLACPDIRTDHLEHAARYLVRGARMPIEGGGRGKDAMYKEGLLVLTRGSTHQGSWETNIVIYRSNIHLERGGGQHLVRGGDRGG